MKIVFVLFFFKKLLIQHLYIGFNLFMSSSYARIGTQEILYCVLNQYSQIFVLESPWGDKYFELSFKKLLTFRSDMLLYPLQGQSNSCWLFILKNSKKYNRHNISVYNKASLQITRYDLIQFVSTFKVDILEQMIDPETRARSTNFRQFSLSV